MNLGVVSRSFPELSNQQVADLLAASGFDCTELCFSQTDSKYWVYNGRSDLSDMTDARSRSIVESYRKAGIAVPVLGVFTNLIEPDESERSANIAYFERMAQIAAVNAIPTLSTECGFIPGQRGINADRYEADFDRLRDSFERLARIADRYAVDIALEACVLDVVPSAKRARDFLRQVGSDRIKILLDPANFIANSSESDMFHYLAPQVAYIHGKDRKVNDKMGRIVGDGDIDWPYFLALRAHHTPQVPVIFEYVNHGNFTMVKDRLLEYDQQSKQIDIKEYQGD